MDSLPMSSSPSKSPQLMRWVSVIVILGVLAVGLFIFLQIGRSSGSVTLLLLNSEGERQVGDLSLQTGSLSLRPDVDATQMKLENEQESFELSDGSVISVEPAGIVRRINDSDSVSLLVATPVAALGKTPLAVWGEGKRVAWVNPADRSLQVFERNSRGTYLPLYLNKDIFATSMGFTADGNVLVVAKYLKDKTDISALNLKAQSVVEVESLPGFASIIEIP